jgi:hypothetical protein
MTLHTLDAHEVMSVGGGLHIFNFSRRTHEPYFAPEELTEDGDATEH